MADVTGGTPPTGASEFNPPADIKEVYDHFGDLGRFYSVANVAALPSTGNWVGRRLTVADTGYEYRWVSGGWTITAGDSGWITPTLNAGWTTYAGEVPRYKFLNGVVFLVGRATGTAAAGTTVFSLPAGFRHTYGSDLVFQGHSDNGTALITVGPTGVVHVLSRPGDIRQGVSFSGVRFPAS
ncbi:hypothetical protein [uncultured Microbacterium sp.]|uniref:hypothetical protein n=1 Tax=uncultured Microbacterium sp. TaxID=191216 RepID=UPI0026263E27|nr:hypothetical protein [uncultured Microbacterium sp.]